MDSIIKRNKEPLQIDRIVGDSLKHVCHYAESPCPACCYARGLKDADPTLRYAYTFSLGKTTKTPFHIE